MDLDLRAYIDILKRHRWIIVEAALVVAVLAGVFTALKTPTYTATAKVLLRPNDPSETVTPDKATGTNVDPDRNVSAQMSIVKSAAVAAGAATELKSGSPDQLQAQVRVAQAGQNDILNISAQDVDPGHARDVANAFAHAYIENRRQFEVGTLQQAADQIQTKLVQLQTRIAQFDGRINESAPPAKDGAKAATPTAPVNPVAGAAPAGATAPDGLTGALPTDSDTLTAARYAAQVQYQSLFQQQQDIAVDISLKRGEAELISAAEVPTVPSSTSPKHNAALGLMLGLLLGVGVALLREQLNDKVRSRQEAESVTGLPVIAELPLDPESTADGNRLSAADLPFGPLAEATRALRTSLQFLGVDDPLRTIVITSAGPGDGKSFVAANLAVVCAQAGLRTVVVSGDVRKPRLARMFGVSPSALGLTDVLAEMSALDQGVERDIQAEGDGGGAAGNGHHHVDLTEGGAGAAWWMTGVNDSPRKTRAGATKAREGGLSVRQRTLVRQALVSTTVPNLALMPSGAVPPNPAELLGSKRASEVFEELRALADIVIIDTPPVLAVTDAVVLAEQADGVLIVTALDETKRASALRSKELLSSAHTRLLGLVLNKVGGSQAHYYGYYQESEDHDADSPSGGGRHLDRARRLIRH